MPNVTKKLGLNILLENDIVDFEQINENFQKIDDYIYKQVYITVKGVIDNV